MTEQIIEFYTKKAYKQTTEFNAIDIKAPKNTSFLLVWDIGKRCNYDCTYCGPTRHDLRSPHIEWDVLVSTVEYVFEYFELMMMHKVPAERNVTIVFTGGEPTVNPRFLDFCKYIRDEHRARYKDKYNLSISLTSNGTFSRKTADKLLEHIDRMVISYHTEADPRLKSRVVDTIKYLKEKKCTFSVNVMMHAKEEYFQECISLMDELKSLNINYTPRIIGDRTVEKTKDDFSTHVYTDEQEKWIKDFWDQKNAEVKLKEIEHNKDTCASQATDSARKLGRMCCGGKTMTTFKDGQEQPAKFLESTFFHDWYCAVNWYFMCIDQQWDKVYHHQTCQARFDQTKGEIGTVTEFQKIIDKLRSDLENNTMPIIKCPNPICNCGICTPKSVDKDQFLTIMSTHVDNTEIFN